jgi:hypothetical protein
MRVIEICRVSGCGCLILCHTSKSDKVEAIHRIAGSVDWVGASRSVLICGADPDDKSDTAAIHVKSNVGPLGKSIGYKIDDTGKFGWTGDSTLTANRIYEKPEGGDVKGRKEAFFDWLCTQLYDGAKASAELEKDAKAEGMYSERLFREMRTNRKDVFRNFKNGPVWWMELRGNKGDSDPWWNK